MPGPPVRGDEPTAFSPGRGDPLIIWPIHPAAQGTEQRIQVWPTPRSANNHAKHIRHFISRHSHPKQEGVGFPRRLDLVQPAPGDARYRRILHWLWIAAGSEALAYTQATGQAVRADRTWANLYDLRNHLAHSRLPDIDESLVSRFTWARLDSDHWGHVNATPAAQPVLPAS